MLKILLVRRQFLVYLLVLEFIIIMNYVLILSSLKSSNRSYLLLFVFIVTIVIGAVVGISIMVAQSRSSDNQLELILIKG